MRERAVIKLSKPLRSHGGEQIHQIVLREPTYDEYLIYGDPYTVAASQNGTPFAVDNPDVIKQYIALCLVEPKDPALLSQAGARVARAVKEKLLSFFQPDAQEGEASATSQTNSPSEASGTTASPNSKS